MPFATPTFPERYEGMLVRFPQSLVIAEYFNYDRFGEIVLALPLAGESRPFTRHRDRRAGRGRATPAPPRTRCSRITLDDNLERRRTRRSCATRTASRSRSTNRFRGGDTVAEHGRRARLRLQPLPDLPDRRRPTTPPSNPRPAAPEPVGGTLRVAAMNTLNFFLTLDYDRPATPARRHVRRQREPRLPRRGLRPAATSSRGSATSCSQALAGLNADVIGLNELENTPGVDPLGDPTGIVPGLNALLGAGTYAAIDTGTIGTDAITRRPDLQAGDGHAGRRRSRS